MFEFVLALAAIFAPLALVGLAVEWLARKEHTLHEHAPQGGDTMRLSGPGSRR